MNKYIILYKHFCSVIAVAFLLFLSSMTLSAQPVEGRKYADIYLERYAEFEKESPIVKSDIVFLGNSLTQGGKWSEYFPKTSTKLSKKGGAIRNRGIIGDDAQGIYDRLNQILPGKPSKIFLLVGVNDISHHISGDSIKILVERVVERIRRESPKSKLYLQSLLPYNAHKSIYKNMKGKTDVVREVNVKLEEIAKEYKIKFIELYNYFTEPNSFELKPELTRDGLHINADGYAIWQEQIEKYVK